MKTLILHAFNLPSKTVTVSNIAGSWWQGAKSVRRNTALEQEVSLLSALPPYLLNDIGLPGFDKLPMEAQKEQYVRAAMAKG